MRLRFLVWMLLTIALGLAGATQSSILVTALYQRVEICADGHAQEVFVDQAGEMKTGHPDCPHCPDCALPALALVSGVLGKPRIATARAVRSHSLRQRAPQRVRHHAPLPRGPPTAANIQHLSNRHNRFSLSRLTLVKCEPTAPWQGSGCIQLDPRR